MLKIGKNTEGEQLYEDSEGIRYTEYELFVLLKTGYEEGIPLRKLAEKYGLSRETIRTKLRDAGVERRPSHIHLNSPAVLRKIRKTRRKKLWLGGKIETYEAWEIHFQEHAIRRRYVKKSLKPKIA